MKNIDFPPKDSNWNIILKYALSFNGYEYWGGIEKCSKIANNHREKYFLKGELSNDIKILKTCLFFEQRASRHSYNFPSVEDKDYILNLFKEIHRLLED